jgi:hypothetical protein
MRTISIICLFISCLLFACNKDIFDSDGYYGTGTVTMNTQTLTAKLKVVGDDRFCLPDTCINFSVDSFSSDGILRTSYGVWGIPAKVGRYALKPNAVIGGSGQLKLLFSIYVGDGSALTSYGTFEESPEDYVEITKYNPTTGDIEGIFAGRLIQDSFWLPPSMPVSDTLVLENGYFKGKVKWD